MAAIFNCTSLGQCQVNTNLKQQCFSQAKGFHSNKGRNADHSTNVEYREVRCCAQPKQTSIRKSNAGLSLIEWIGGLAIVSILFAVLVPSPQSLAAPNDVTEASKEVLQALRTARSTAFFNQSEISVSIADDAGTSWIYFELPKQSRIDVQQFQDRGLPESVRVDEYAVRYTFNGQGEVDKQGQILLRSKFDDSLYSIVTVETNKGFVRSCFSEELRKHIPGMSCEELFASEVNAESCDNINCYLISNQQKLGNAQKN